MCGLSATTPPTRRPSAVTAACSTGSEIVVRTAGAWCGRERLSTRAPATSSPPGVPSRRSSKIRSRPETPTSASAGTPSAASSSRRSGGIGPSWPTTCGASSEGEERSSPLASTCGRGRAAWRARASASRGAAARPRQPREDERARPVDRRRSWRAGRPRRRRCRTRAWGCAPVRGRRCRPCAAGPWRPSPPSRSQRVEVGGGEARAGHAVAIGGGQLGVHRRVVAALPGGREALDVRLAGRLWRAPMTRPTTKARPHTASTAIRRCCERVGARRAGGRR